MTSIINITVEALYGCVSTHYVYINRATLCDQSMVVIRPLLASNIDCNVSSRFGSPMIRPSALQVLQKLERRD